MNDEFNNERAPVDERTGAAPLEPTESAPEPRPEPLPPPLPPRPRGAPDRSATLLKLAEEYFGNDLTAADRKLFRAVANGWVADFSDHPLPPLLQAILGDPQPGKNDPAGAEEWGDDRVIQAECIRWLLTDPLARQHILPHEGVSILGARIDGELRLSGCSIDWSLHFVGCRFTDQTLLHDATIGLLNMHGTHTASIFAPRLRVSRSLLLREGFRADGEVNLLGAMIGGSLDCHAGTFSNPNGYALKADGIKVDGAVFLRHGFEARGEVRMPGATIGVYLDCEGATFINSDGRALVADRIKVYGNVFLKKRFNAEGEVRLLGATIGGNLECDAATFLNLHGHALYADGIKVDGNVFLSDGFKAEGQVRLLGATIGGNLECDAGTFSNPTGYALSAGGIKVDGSLFLRDEFEADGAVDFTVAQVDRWFHWRNIRNPKKATLALVGARVGTLWDQESSWPKELHLDGFVYDRIYHEAPTNAKARLDWLARQPGDRYLPQPYNQLAKVLQQMGHEQDARKIHYAKVNDPQRLADMTRLGRAWHHVLRWTIGNGYYPARALRYAVFFVLFGWGLFFLADRTGDMIATGNSSDPPVAFNALVYSLDAFVPLIDLHQVKYAHPIRWEVRAYFWMHILAGWFLTTLLVAGFTGLVRK